MITCAQCGLAHDRRGSSLTLLGEDAELAHDILARGGANDQRFCSPGCLLMFAEPRLTSLVRSFKKEFCHFCEKRVAEGVAFSAPYDSLLDTIGAGVAHAACFMKRLRDDVAFFEEHGMKPWFLTGHEPSMEEWLQAEKEREERGRAAYEQLPPEAQLCHDVLRLVLG